MTPFWCGLHKNSWPQLGYVKITLASVRSEATEERMQSNWDEEQQEAKEEKIKTIRFGIRF